MRLSNVQLELTAEQHGFELHGSTYTQIVFNSETLQDWMARWWLNPQTQRLVIIHPWAAAAVQSLSRVRLLATSWTVARQAPPSMAFPGQEYWRGVPFPSPDLPDPGIRPESSLSLALVGGFFATEQPEKPHTSFSPCVVQGLSRRL